MQKELDKIDGAELVLAESIHGVEQAQADVNVAKALKTGNDTIKSLRSAMPVEQFEEILDDHQEQVALYEKEQEMFGEVLDNDELENELNNLIA